MGSPKDDGPIFLKPWKVIRDELVLDASPWFSVTREVLQLPDGRQITDYYQVNAPSYAEIVPVRTDGKIQCMWQYKHGPRRVTLGLPAGYIRADERALAAAQRELHEECGLISGDWTSLGKFTMDGNRGKAEAHLFLAWNCVTAESISSDDLEVGERVWLRIDELEAHLRNGTIAMLGATTAMLLALPLIRRRFGTDVASAI